MVDRQRTVGPQITARSSCHAIEIHGSVVVELRTAVAGPAARNSGTQVRDQPNGLIGGVVCPYLIAVRRVKYCRKVERVAQNHNQLAIISVSIIWHGHRTTLGTGIVHLPRCPIRSIVRPQLRQPCGIVSRIEIQRVADEHRHVVARCAAVATGEFGRVRMNIGHKPRGMVRGVVRIELSTRAVTTFCTEVEHLVHKHERHVSTGAATAPLVEIIAGSNVGDQPRGVIRSVVSPQFPVVNPVIGIEVNGIANENGRTGSRSTAVSSVADVSHLPSGCIGRVVRPQLMTVVSIVSSEIDGVIDEVRKKFISVIICHGQPRIRTAPDVGHLPRRAVGGVVRPEFNPRASIVCGEVDGIANKDGQMLARIAVRTVVDVADYPAGVV